MGNRRTPFRVPFEGYAMKCNACGAIFDSGWSGNKICDYCDSDDTELADDDEDPGSGPVDA